MTNGRVEPVVAGSHNAGIGLPTAWAILADGGTALDAVEAATRIVEDNEADHSVGYAGMPNLLGEVELDASIMDGEHRRVGAVGAVKGFRHPVTIARAVMDQLPHTFLVGAGAERFATDLGMEPEDLLTDETRELWRSGIESRLPANLDFFRETLATLTALATDVRKVAGTVNVLARDVHGHFACAVSTTGWAWKHPGRIGDSPVIGAGIYADDRHGAVGCTGMGELSTRACLAHDIVVRMAAGADIETAGRAAFDDMAHMGSEFPTSAVMDAVVIDRDGRVGGFSTLTNREVVFMKDGDSEPRRMPKTHVHWPGALREI